MHPMLNIAVKAARRAGSIINRASLDTGALEISRKRQNDFVTQVDRAAEAAILEIIQRAYPDHGVLAEESGAQEGKGERKGTASDYRWLIDPLDGTTNFIHGFPQYAVSIALEHKGVLTHGVVYDPEKNELFTASRGRGAYLNERRIRVSRLAKIEDALIGTGVQFRDVKGLNEYIAMFRAVVSNTSGIRRAGSAALDLAWLAAGRLDGFWEMGLQPWDMAAGALLVQEAGGIVGELNLSQEAGRGYLESGRILGGNPKVFDQLLKLLGPLSRTAQSPAALTE